MTNQEIFDKVSAHLLSQGTQALEGGECRYRTSTGLSCAVGCLISDEAYNEALEGQLVAGTVIWSALEASGIDLSEQSYDLLMRLQSLHDFSKPETWPAGLHKIAEALNLETH